MKIKEQSVDLLPTNPRKASAQRIHTFKRNFKRDWQLWALALIPLTQLLIFHYGPMYGVQIAFRDYSLSGGVAGSEWVGLKWFVDFLTDPKFGRIFSNTIILNLYYLITFPLSVIMALLLNSMMNKRYRKTVQTISYLPHFISTTVFVGIINMILSPTVGIYGNMYRLFGGEGLPVDFKATAEAFRHIYVWSGVWQSLGWGTILYTSALSAVPVELHEAASIDGASRFKRIWYVDLPTIMPTVGITFIMRIGSLVGVGFEKAYLLQSNINKSTAEVVSTYVYRKGMNSFRNYSYGAAVDLFNTVINIALVFAANAISRKVSEGEVSLF